ncbi:hypothetical protein K260102G11_19790 [Bacteroides uniformis]|uniref:tape measure protein n=2 Tax=Bacteria TaxID=2 RepID=UPI0034B3028A
MAKLYFKVGSDWEEVVRLRNEIAKLKQELMSMDGTQSPAAFKALNVQLAASNQRLDELVTNAAKAGAEMETGFKRKIFDASQSVNGFTEKIIAQKSAIGSLQTTIRKNKELYKNIVSRGGEDKELLNHINKQERALGKERDALFNLTQQQAEARLSVKKLRDEYTLYKNDGKQVVETNEGIAISWKKALAVIGGAGVLKALGSEMIRVRGEFQSMQTAIETMVGEDIAGRLIPQIKELAKISPLTMSDMVGAEKMMLGFNIQAEDTIKYLKAISDISMGESSKFNSLTLAFSQMSAAGKLMGQDLNQMINAGFNPLQIISEKTGKSIATLKDEMSKGAVSAEMVQQAFIDATSAGGKFYNMSENASKTINGQLSMMQDALDAAFNEMGQASESVIMSGIKATTSLIQNYETVGKVLVGLVATYGAYRTAVILTTIATSKHTIAEIALTNARVLARKAQIALNAAMLTNPYVALATVVTGLVATMWVLSTRTSEAEKATERFNAILDEHTKKEDEHKQAVDSLISSIQDQNKSDGERIAAFEKLKAEYPSIFQNYTTETEFLKDIVKYKRLIAEEDAKRSTSSLENSLRIEQDKLNHYRLVRAKGTSTSLVDIDGNGWATDNVEDAINAQLSVVNRLKAEISKPVVNSYLENIKEMKDEDIKSVLDEITLSMNALGKSGKESIAIVSSLSGEFSKEQLGLIRSALETEQKSRTNKTTYKQDYEKAKKEWEDAKKELSEIEKDKSKFTSKQYEEAKKRVETTEKAYKNLGGITGSSLTKQDNQTEKLRKQTDKYNALLDKQSLEQQRSAEDLQMRVDEARIKAMDEGSAKTIAEMELNFEKEMQAIDRQKEDAFRKKVEDARAAWEANPKNKGKSFNATDIKLSDDEQNYYDELYKTAIISNEKIYKDLAERYLSYADERLAIEKKFNDDISILQEARKKAETKGDASEIAQIDRSIEKRTEIKNEDIFKLDAEQFKKNMNWEQVFGNLDKVSTDTLKKLKANLKDFISSQKDLSPESLKELVDAIERIDDKVSERDPFETMSISFKSLKEVTDAQREAQKAYNKALEEGTDEEKKNAKATLESAKNSKQKALYEATDALHKGINEIGQYVDAGNQVIGIMETLGIKTPEWMEGTMSGFGEMLNGLGNIDLMKPMSIITGSLQTVKGALTSVISLGGLIPGLDGADYSHYNEMVEEYNKLNEIWDELIDKKLEYINTSYGAEADKVGKEALELVNKSIEAYRILGRERLNSGASAGSHSIGKRMAKNTSSSDWQDIADALDMSVKDAKDFIGTGRMTGLFDLTTEQLEKLKSEAPTFWAKLDGDVRDYLDKIIEGEERIEEIHNQINEQLTQTTFDGVYSNFIDTLMDMKASSKDAAEDVSEYFMQAMLSEQIGTLYQDKLKKWYEKFAKGMEDGSLTESERNALNSEYMGYIEEAMKLRDELAAATGYDKISQESTSQLSTSRGFGTEMTHEDAGELSGRFTALQIAGEEIKNQNIIQSQSLNLLTVKADALLSINTETRNIADDTRDLIAQSYLELVQISENTGAIVKPIIQIQKDMAEVKNNTSKL